MQGLVIEYSDEQYIIQAVGQLHEGKNKAVNVVIVGEYQPDTLCMVLYYMGLKYVSSTYYVSSRCQLIGVLYIAACCMVSLVYTCVCS